ncbi:MAG TPA: sigma-70 family RNA polymerase sigma factor [Vicinamibacterales bacterium]
MTTIAHSWMKSPDRRIPSTGAVADPPAEALRLFNEHGGAIYRFCRSMLRNESEAEDVVQETFLKLLQHLRADSLRSNIRSWLFTVAANACRDRMRWRMRWLPWSEEEDQRTVPPREDDEDRQRARATLRLLAPRDRMLLSLRANGLSYREIAVATGIREQSVGRLLARAVDRWKRAVDRRLV